MLSLLLLVAPALAVDPIGDDEVRQTSTSDKPLAAWLADLTSDDDNKRLYAARVVHGTLRRDLRITTRAREGSLAYDDARAEMVELEERVPSACIVSVDYSNTAALCADMLAWLEVTDARPALEQALAKESRQSVRKRLEAALASIPTVAK